MLHLSLELQVLLLQIATVCLPFSVALGLYDCESAQTQGKVVFLLKSRPRAKTSQKV